MKLLIDGENVRHQIAHVLRENKKLEDKNDYFSFDFAGFLGEALAEPQLEITYYTTRIKQPHQKIPVQLQKRITTITEANRRWIADLTNQKIEVVKAGYLRVRESSSCVHCGKKTLMMQEKGVDVRLAVDLVECSKKLKSVILGSSDSDLLPSVEVVTNNGCKVIYLCYAGWLNQSIASRTYKTITFDDKLVMKYFKGVKT